MSDSTSPTLIEKVRQALGRAQPLSVPPTPPVLDDALCRLVARDANLAAVFIKSAVEAKFLVEQVTENQLPEKLIAFLAAQQCRKIGLSVCSLLNRLDLRPKLNQAGLQTFGWEELTLDAAYDLDCGVTDAPAAIAETGSIMIRPDANQGRALSLLPRVHVAIIDPKNLFPDLIDLFEHLSNQSAPSAVTFITGPSKTADIEGALVTGVHGPRVVQLYLIKPDEDS